VRVVRSDADDDEGGGECRRWTVLTQRALNVFDSWSSHELVVRLPLASASIEQQHEPRCLLKVVSAHAAVECSMRDAAQMQLWLNQLLVLKLQLSQRSFVSPSSSANGAEPLSSSPSTSPRLGSPPATAARATLSDGDDPAGMSPPRSLSISPRGSGISSLASPRPLLGSSASIDGSCRIDFVDKRSAATLLREQEQRQQAGARKNRSVSVIARRSKRSIRSVKRALNSNK
jgi:hypothetical protein